MSEKLEQLYKSKEIEMINTCAKQSHKRTRLILEMKEIMKQLKTKNNICNTQIF